MFNFAKNKTTECNCSCLKPKYYMFWLDLHQIYEFLKSESNIKKN